MSAKLIKALASGKVIVRKLVSGEVLIKFNNPEIKDIVISSLVPTEISKFKDVTVNELRKSNLKDLITKRMLVVE